MTQSLERLSVWTALSQFYLDTELTEEELLRITTLLRQSPFSREEIVGILRDEVAPAFTFNLLSIAGEWTFWTEEEVQTIIEQWLAQKSDRRWFVRLRNRFRPVIIPSQWAQIVKALD